MAMTSSRLRAGPIAPAEAVPAPRAEVLLVECFERDYASLHRLAYLMLGDRDLAEDVVQDAFLHTFTGWHRLREPTSAGAYLRCGVVNTCLSRIRRRKSEQASNATVGRGADQPEPIPQPEEAGATAWLASAVLEAVRTLPPRQRAAVVLRYYADLSEAEMAAALGCAPGTVKSQLAKARSSLSLQLAGVAAEVGIARTRPAGETARKAPKREDA